MASHGYAEVIDLTTDFYVDLQPGQPAPPAIDLTWEDDDDEDYLPSRVKPALRATEPSRKAAKKSSKSIEDSKIIRPKSRSFKKYLKAQVAKEYDLEKELDIVEKFPLESAIMKTVVPHRYMRIAGVTSLEQPERPQTAGLRWSCLAKKKTTKLEQGFAGSLQILDGPQALKEALEEHVNSLTSANALRLVMYTDGSFGTCSTIRAGSAVVYRQPDSALTGWLKWKAYGFKVDVPKSGKGATLQAHLMECIGIIKALDIAYKYVKNEFVQTHPGKSYAVKIYTDARSILEKLEITQNGKKNTSTVSRINARKKAMEDPLMRHMVKKAKGFQALGATLTLAWCPAHSKVPGNELADRVAGYAGRYVYNNKEEVWVDLSDDEEEDIVDEEQTASVEVSEALKEEVTDKERVDKGVVDGEGTDEEWVDMEISSDEE